MRQRHQREGTLDGTMRQRHQESGCPLLELGACEIALREWFLSALL